MKPNVTYVDGEKLMALVREAGCATKEQSGNFRVESKTCPGCRLYVPRTKKVCRIDLSGFVVPTDMGVRDLGGESFGNVRQQLDFSVPEEAVLANFKKLLDHLNSIPPGSSPVRPRTEKQKDYRPSGIEPATEEAPKAPADERRERIMARAQQLMVTVPGMAVGAAVLQAQRELASEPVVQQDLRGEEVGGPAIFIEAEVVPLADPGTPSVEEDETAVVIVEEDETAVVIVKDDGTAVVEGEVGGVR